MPWQKLWRVGILAPPWKNLPIIDVRTQKLASPAPILESSKKIDNVILELENVATSEINKRLFLVFLRKKIFSLTPGRHPGKRLPQHLTLKHFD